jgi:hypothetical protein
MAQTQMYFGRLVVQLPPVIDTQSDSTISRDDISEEDIFGAVMVSPSCQTISPHSSFLSKKKDTNEVKWVCDISSSKEVERQNHQILVPVLKKNVVIKLTLEIHPRVTEKKKDDETPKPKKRPVDGIPVNFRGIPPNLVDEAGVFKFFQISKESVYKVMLNTRTGYGLDGKEYILSKGTCRIIFLKSSIPEQFNRKSGDVVISYLNQDWKIYFTSDTNKREAEERKEDISKRRKILESMSQPKQEQGSQARAAARKDQTEAKSSPQTKNQQTHSPKTSGFIRGPDGSWSTPLPKLPKNTSAEKFEAFDFTGDFHLPSSSRSSDSFVDSFKS